MTTPSLTSSGPLAPLLSALLSRARRDADAVLAEARADAEAVTARAHERAQALLSEARMKGEADGQAVVRAERARAERSARAIVLAAQRAAYDRSRLAAREAVSALRTEPGYPQIRDALSERAIRSLGEGADVREVERGGIVATAGSRSVDLSLDALADDIVDRLGPQVEGVWTA